MAKKKTRMTAKKRAAALRNLKKARAVLKRKRAGKKKRR